VYDHVTDPIISPASVQAPWHRRHDDDDDRALGHVTSPDFRYARGDVIGPYEQPPTQCRDCCNSLEMGVAAATENVSHAAHHYHQLYQ